MAAPAPIALILGSGPRIGAAVAARYKELGYSVAVVSRRGPAAPAVSEASGYLEIGADLADAGAYAGIYDAVQQTFGGGGGGGGGGGVVPVPDVVFFNAASLTFPAEEGNLFSAPLEGLRRDLDLSVTGAFVAAREAYARWEAAREAGSTRSRQFIFTGNCLSSYIVPNERFVTLGIHKNATAYWVGLADSLYKQKGFRFLVADQREADGGPAYNPSAEAHAELVDRIAKDPESWPFYITFHDGTKFVDFGRGRTWGQE